MDAMIEALGDLRDTIIRKFSDATGIPEVEEVTMSNGNNDLDRFHAAQRKRIADNLPPQTFSDWAAENSVSLSDAVQAVGGGHPSAEEQVKHEPLPVAGYVPQSQANVDLVNDGKYIEETMIRYLERVELHILNNSLDAANQIEMLNLGYRTIQTGCMWVYRSIMNPKRTVLPGEEPAAK